jgi:YegS/Rv2252/BmrU family lipid kinase
MQREVCLIVNPAAGGGRAAARLPAVEAALRRHGVSFREERTSSIDHARELAADARDAGETVIAMGGDGLTGALAGVLHGSEALLGVVPGGRGNDFARKLGIPEDPEAAVAVIAGGSCRTVDVALCDGRPYLGILSAGFDSDVQVIANDTALKLGDGVYVYGALRALARWRPARWTVTVDGARREFSGYSVAVANTGVFGGGMRLVPDAQVDDGLLDVVLTAHSSRVHLLRGLRKVFRGTHVTDPALTFLQGREVVFEADRPFTAFADGDPIAELPVRIGIAPRSLKVLAP